MNLSPGRLGGPRGVERNRSIVMPAYVLLTAARNEELHIEKTLESVLSQTIRPVRWVIVSDGSTDRTDEIVRRYAERFPNVFPLRSESSDERNFGSKVRALENGFDRTRDLQYEYIGFLDADVSFESDYFARLFGKFESDSRLGIAGGVIHDRTETGFRRVFGTPTSVAGAVQTFRRSCYEAIGGYRPIPTGGIDTVAEVSARMHGWKTLCFPDLVVHHHRPTGSAVTGSLVRTRLRQGKSDYFLGYHPLFYLFREARRTRERPYVVGSALRLYGYFSAFCSGRRPAATDDFVEYFRREQLRRLFTLNVSGTR